MIKTIGELKKAIENIDDDFTIDVMIARELSEEELKDSKYPYPYKYSKANIEIGDIGYSDKDVFINVYEDGVSDDVCEWKKSEEYPFDWAVGCDGCEVNHRQGGYCPRCGKKINVVE